jgi:hypothetical protein
MEPNFWSDYLKILQLNKQFWIAHWPTLTALLVIFLVIYIMIGDDD